ncbi:hypothetical protein [Frigoriglobus tundricola]|uniref:Uncharacterized protein n=1 Tax=Frigoriglobus tundricola TaxID=2774151 RepID=A0A6M5Z6V8_9BACT|nr:hypothetical protein [Frigoriglobus tundricola]QJX01101.1 hypothetical protein FTUN_8740 [Frigoriglobus tundricola]
MAKRRVTPGTGQLNLEIETVLLDRLRAFGRDRGEKIRHVVEMALRRHMDNPPPPPKPPEVVPLPPVTSPAPAATAPRAPGTEPKPAKRPK